MKLHIKLIALACLIILSLAPAAFAQETPPVSGGTADSAALKINENKYLALSANLGYSNLKMLVLGLGASFRHENLIFSIGANFGLDMYDQIGSMKIEPSQSLKDVSLTFGLAYPWGNGTLSIQSGIGYMSLLLRGDFLRRESFNSLNLFNIQGISSYEYYKEDKHTTFYLPLEASVNAFTGHIGFGINAGLKLFCSRFICQANFVVSVR